MINTLVFDFGHVLTYSMDKHPKYQRRYKRLTEKQKTKMLNAVVKSELGKISYTDLCKVTKQLIFPDKTLSEIRQFFVQTKILPPWGLAKKLSKKYQIIILSNHHGGQPERMARHLKANFHQFPFLNSSYLGMRKPELRFYRHLLKKFNLNPQETIFVDDNKENLLAAKKLKIKTFLYEQNYQELLKYLKKLGVQI